MIRPLSWFLGKFGPSPAHSPSSHGSRKKNRFHLVFRKQKKHKICECLDEPVVAESTPQPQEEAQVGAVTPQVILDAPEAIAIEEVGRPKEKRVESFTLLKLLRVGWMKSQAPVPVHPKEECANQISPELNKMPQSLYLLHDIGHASSTTEVTAVTGMQA